MYTYLLTYSIMQSPSWEANWFAASQEIPRISRNPKVHYRTHKRPPPVSILGQPNPVHIPTSHLLEIHPNIIHPSTSRSPQWSPFLRFPRLQRKHPACECFLTKFFAGRGCLHLAQTPSWRTIPRRLSATDYSIYSQLPSLSEAVPLSATWGRAMPWWQGPTTW